MRKPQLAIPFTDEQLEAIRAIAAYEGLTSAGWARNVLLTTLRDLDDDALPRKLKSTLKKGTN